MEGIDDLLIVTLDVENGERGICSIAFLKSFHKNLLENGCHKPTASCISICRAEFCCSAVDPTPFVVL